MSGRRLQSKFGFSVEDLKPKKGGKPVQGSSIPLILPNDLKYNASTGSVEKAKDVRRASLQVVPEALELLEGIEEPVSVLAICGPCRTGKSYILSRLLGTAEAFELGHLMDPKTFGIWMGTKVLRGKDFTIVLLDTEGIDAVGASVGQDASILVMTILLSSHLIYNSLNVPYKGDLEKMQCFTKLATGIIVKQGKKTDVAAFREFFPDFLWLLRDVSLKMEDENGKEMDPTEYLVTKVLRRDPNAFQESANDKVGRAILTFFPSVECAKLERPSVDPDIMNNIAQNTDRLDPRFNKGVDELTERLLRKARAKRGYDKASTVSGLALSIMTKQYVDAVNDPNSIPAMDNTWQNTVELMRGRAIEEAVAEYNREMQTEIAKARISENGEVPLEEMDIPRQPTLMDLHNASFTKATAMLLEKVRHSGLWLSSEKQGTDESNAVVDQMQKRLVQRAERTVDYVEVVTGGELFKYIQQNKELSRIFCQKLFERLFDPIREHVETPPPDYGFKQLMEELDHARQKYKERARGPEKWAVFKEKTKNLEKLEADFKKIKAYQRKEQQKAHEAEQLMKQQQDMVRAHEETLQKMEKEHKEQLEKVRNELEHANMMEMIKALQQQQADMNKQLMDLMARVPRK